MTIDTVQLVDDMKEAAGAILKGDISQLRGFSERQLEAISKQTELVARGIASGEITEATREFFLDGIEDMVLSFAKTLRGLLMVTIEKLWNAIIGVIWKVISAATGMTLRAPDIA